jgi:hypothetical protein
MKAAKLTGSGTGKHPHVKRNMDEEYINELISDPEFIEFLEGMAAELEQ